MRCSTSLRCTAVAVLAVLAGSAATATPVQLVPNTTNMFRDTRGANSVGVGQGDRVQFGADIVGGSAGTTLGAIYLPTGLTAAQNLCNPLAVNANFCSSSVAFNANRLGQWQLRFINNLDETRTLAPSLGGIEQPVPFPVSVTLSGSGLTPILSWQVPGGFAPDGFRLNIYDKNVVLQTGIRDIIHSVAIAANATSYTVPSLLSSGQQLHFGGNYALNLQLIETRGHVAFSNNNAQILRRSSSFFDFAPLGAGGPPNVALPTIGANGVYHFNVTNVGPSSVTFIDPDVAVGYDYAIGAGDPNFASVLLPDVGDGVFTLEYLEGGNVVQQTLVDGTQFFFPQAGVGAFRVSGIETSAGLDPSDPLAFITGLTFTSQGNFTGTMTPITEFVPGAIPEPETYALMLVGIAAVAAARRRHWPGASRSASASTGTA